MAGEHDNAAFENEQHQPPATITKDENDMKYDLLKSSTSRKRHVTIQRPVYTEEEISRLYGQETTVESFKSKVKKQAKETCTIPELLQRLLSFFPIISWLPQYKKSYILRDFSAGLTLGVMQIPQGMAYGMLTTLPPIYGLYVSLIPVLVYFVMGSSKHLSIGTFAIISLMVGEVVENKVNEVLPLTPPSTLTNGTVFNAEEEEIKLRVKYAVTVSFLVGMIQAILGLLRVGFITIFLSDPLISGFTTGAAFHVFSSQVKHLFGMSVPRKETAGFFSLFKLYIYIFKNITDTNVASLIIGVVATIILLVVKHFTQKYSHKIKFPIPAELIVVVLGTGLSYGVDFKAKFDVPILEEVPKGLPPLSTPMLDKFSDMLIDCASIAIVSYAISVSVAKAFAKKNKYKIDANQELYAHGAVNMIGSFLSCFVASASLSRSVLQENLGSTQVSSLLSSGLIILTLTVLAPLFVYLPRAILASIVLVALRGLFRQFSVLKALLKISKLDSFIWVFSFICVILFGVDYGLALGLAINLVAAIVRISRPSFALMGQVKETEIYLDKEENALSDIPGCTIFQFHAPLFFPNVEYFQETLFEQTVNPSTCIQMTVPPCYQSHAKRKTSDGSDKFYIENEKIESHNHSEVNRNRVLSKDVDVKIQVVQIKEDTEKAYTLKTLADPAQREFCPLHTIILDCSQICYCDTMGIGALVSVCSEYKNVGVNVYFASCPAKFLHSLQVGGFVEKHGSENMFVTIHDAVQYTLSHEHYKGICDPTLKENIPNGKSYLVADDESSISRSCQEADCSSTTDTADLEKV